MEVGVHKLKAEVEQFADISWEEFWQKRGSIFSPILEDSVHAMTLPNQKTAKQKKIQVMTA